MTGLVGQPMRVYLDECVDVLIGQLLSSRGFDCLTAIDAGHLGWSDEKHLEFAHSESRVLITHNRVDFEGLAITWWAQQKDHAGIILAIRRADSYALARHLFQALNRYDQAGWRNVLLVA